MHEPLRRKFERRETNGRELDDDGVKYNTGILPDSIDMPFGVA
jgi:hypothetical protein